MEQKAPLKTTLRYSIFAAEYVIDLNASRAALAAGYSEKTAPFQASRLLKNRKVLALIDKHLSRRASKLEVTSEKVLQELAKLAFSNMGDYARADQDGKPIGINLSQLSPEQWAAVQEIREDTTGGSGDGERKAIVRTTLKLADKGLNLERLGRHLKLFTDKVEVTGMEGLAERLNKIRNRKNGDSSSKS